MANATEATLVKVLQELQALRAELKARGTDAVPLEVRQAALTPENDVITVRQEPTP